MGSMAAGGLGSGGGPGIGGRWGWVQGRVSRGRAGAWLRPRGRYQEEGQNGARGADDHHTGWLRRPQPGL